MEITDFKDFYIDLDGDVKASFDSRKLAKFITTKEKADSEYFFAESFNHLQKRIHEINSMFDPTDKKLLTQFALKMDANGNVVGIKVYGDYQKNENGLEYVLIGYDINSIGFDVEYYFMGSQEHVNQFIQENSLNYDIKNFETHTPFLYSVKKNESGDIINFKSYYAINSDVRLYTNTLAKSIKKILSSFRGITIFIMGLILESIDRYVL